MGAIDLESVARRVAANPSAGENPWTAMSQARGLLDECEQALMQVITAEYDGLLRPGTGEKIGGDMASSIVAFSSRLQGSLRLAEFALSGVPGSRKNAPACPGTAGKAAR